MLDIQPLVLMGFLKQFNDSVVQCLPPPFPLLNLPDHSRSACTKDVSSYEVCLNLTLKFRFKVYLRAGTLPSL